MTAYPIAQLETIRPRGRLPLTEILKILVTATEPAGLAVYVEVMAFFPRNHRLRTLA